MYYLELIQRFWDFNKTAKISPTEALLYFYLLKMGYENDRYDFKISDIELGKELGLTRKTIKSTKEKLKNLGLVQFQSKNGLPCHYRLLLNYSFEIEYEKLCKTEGSKAKQSQKAKIFEIPENILSAKSIIDFVSEVEIDNNVQTSSDYNNQRYHESLKNLTPADMYFSRADEILKIRQQIKCETIKRRKKEYYKRKLSKT